MNEIVYGAFGRKPLIHERYIKMIKYWFKLLKQTNDRLTKSVYNIQNKSADRHESKSNWASLLRDMLFNFGFGELWLNQGVGDEKLFLAVFKQRIGDTYLQTWNQNINNNRKSILYKNFRLPFLLAYA